MRNLYKVKEGKIVAGVCSGLEASGKGNAWLYRIIFLPPACLIGYLFLALTMKSAETIDEVKEKRAEEDKKRLEGSVDKIEIKIDNLTKTVVLIVCGIGIISGGIFLKNAMETGNKYQYKCGKLLMRYKYTGRKYELRDYRKCLKNPWMFHYTDLNP